MRNRESQKEQLERAGRLILSTFGRAEEPDLLATPERFADFYLTALNVDPLTVLLNSIIESETYSGMVVEKKIPFYSMCEHHLLPFFGTADIAYVPGTPTKLVGLSKIVRALQVLAARPSLQERLTSQISEVITQALQPSGVAVKLEATHLCMTARGAKADATSTTSTQVLTGVFLEPGNFARSEFFAVLERS